MRQPLAIGNWKLNGSKQLTSSLISGLRCALPNNSNCQVAIAPPMLYLDQASALLNDDGHIALAAQNVDVNLCGAFTGEISARMLKEFAVTFVIIGHSERRYYHQESDALIAQKFAHLVAYGLLPVLCIGETEAQRRAGDTEKVCATQLNAVIQRVGSSALQNSVIAYEPIWAIGSGQSASPQQAQAVHHFIRGHLAEQNTAASTTRLLYGGSVNEHNAQQLCQMPDIDGVLVGVASLKSETFSAIVHAVATATLSE